MSEVNEKQHPIQGVMDTAMDNIKQMVDVNTIIGDPITTPDGTVIIPVSKVSFGFASGGSDFATKANEAPTNASRFCFGGGGGAGVTIQPIAFLVVTSAGSVSMLPVAQPTFSAIDKAIDTLPTAIDKIKGLFAKKDKKEETASDAE